MLPAYIAFIRRELKLPPGSDALIELHARLFPADERAKPPYRAPGIVRLRRGLKQLEAHKEPASLAGGVRRRPSLPADVLDGEPRAARGGDAEAAVRRHELTTDQEVLASRSGRSRREGRPVSAEEAANRRSVMSIFNRILRRESQPEGGTESEVDAPVPDPARVRAREPGSGLRGQPPQRRLLGGQPAGEEAPARIRRKNRHLRARRGRDRRTARGHREDAHLQQRQRQGRLGAREEAEASTSRRRSSSSATTSTCRAGKVRLRRKGGGGGQKGMADIIRVLKSEAFPRVRIGIGRPSCAASRRGSRRTSPIGCSATRRRTRRRYSTPASSAPSRRSSARIEHGIDEAMNRYNRDDGGAPSKEPDE